jgi:hypothetical protein
MVTCVFVLSLTQWHGSAPPEIFIGSSVDCAPGGLLMVLHHELMLCATPNSLTTPQPFYALLKCCSPWQFVCIFVAKPMLRHLGILISSSSAWLNGLLHNYSVWGLLTLQGSWMTPALAGHCQR